MFWNVLYGSAVFLILAASKLPVRDRNKKVSVAQWLEHCVSNAKVVGSIPREHTYWQYKCIAWISNK